MTISIFRDLALPFITMLTICRDLKISSAISDWEVLRFSNSILIWVGVIIISLICFNLNSANITCQANNYMKVGILVGIFNVFLGFWGLFRLKFKFNFIALVEHGNDMTFRTLKTYGLCDVM